MASRFDVIVIGGGPAGYVAAIRCAQLGMNTACVDAWRDRQGRSVLGGTCLNSGCIPSKALLESSEIYEQAQGAFALHGVRCSGVELDLKAMMARKDSIVSSLTRGIAGLFKAHKITWVTGRARLLPQKRVEVRGHGESGYGQMIDAENIILAPGSVPVEMGVAPLDGRLIVDSAGALEFQEVPPRLGIIGAGVVGLELGSVWRRLGSKVVLLEAQPALLTMTDTQIASEALRLFTAQGLDIRLGTRLVGCQVVGDQVEMTYQDQDGDHRETVDKLVVAVGRRPNTRDLFAPETELLLDEWGVIHIDEHCRTNIPGVYAIGDAIRGPMLAHKGSEEGVMVAERIAGQQSSVNYETVPSVIYTLPEIAWVGKNEQALRAAGIDCRVGVFPFSASGRALALGNTSGMVKVIADAATDRILGVHMIGPHCSELVAEAVIAMQFSASSEDLAMTMFAHPTLSEALHEAALAVDNRAIHIARSRRH